MNTQIVKRRLININDSDWGYETHVVKNPVPHIVHHDVDGIDVPLLEYPALTETGIVKHCFITRYGGASQGIWATMNTGYDRGDDPAAVHENFRRIAKAMDVDDERMVCAKQTHTVNVRLVTEEDFGKGVSRERDYDDIDGLITNISGVTLVTSYADCVPLYFVDPVHKAIGLSHSGWRGTYMSMGAVTLQKMSEAFGTDPADVICAIGPSICQDCYEISADVAEKFIDKFNLDGENEILFQKNSDKFHLNLWAANKRILVEAGVNPNNISVPNVCTNCNPELLFSHRATNGKRGNMGAFLSLK